MNSLWPAATRLSCLRPRLISRPCFEVNSLTARLTYLSFRPYSLTSCQRGTLNGTFQSSHTLARFQRIRFYSSKRIITKYEDLPDNFEEQGGLDFQDDPISQTKATKIFGMGITADQANTILRMLHAQRVSGTLPDHNEPSNASKIEKRVKALGLAWLRKNVPVDEEHCVRLRALEELQILEEVLESDGEKIGTWQPNAEERDNLYAEGVLEKVRKANEEAYDRKVQEEQQQQINKADEIGQNSGPLDTIKPRSHVELRRQGENPWLKHYLERAKILPEKPPEMSKFKRLYPSALVVLFVIAASCTFAHFYTPPKKSARLWPDVPPAFATIATIILVNVLITCLWHHPPAFRLLNKYFISVPGYPFAWSVVGGVLSHQAWYHLATNMFVLFWVGTRVHDEVGRANFLAIYFGVGALASFASLSSFVIANNFISATLGASGAVSGIIAVYLWLHREDAIKILGVFPPDNWPQIPSWLMLSFLIGTDVVMLRKNNPKVQIDHWAHLGGYAGGIGAAEILRWRTKEKRRLDAERRRNWGLVGRLKGGCL